MRIRNKIFKLIPAVTLMVTLSSCEKDYYYETPLPKSTSTLEASRVTTAPLTIGSAYWKSADYLSVNSVNVSTNQLYSDGFLNMTASYLGLNSFNKGTDPKLRLKAAYDNDNLYILAEWTDFTVDLSNSSWLFNGLNDTLKSDPVAGWTSQRNSDRFALAFEISNASGPAGSFGSVGCAASCHTNAGIASMSPTAGSVDIWNWSLFGSAPLGYAEDMNASTGIFSDDAGQPIYVRNANGSTSRSGPAFEWDGRSQNVTLSNGSSSILDPAYYIFNKTAFIGDAARGDSIYHSAAPPGDCVYCHGDRGQGGSSTAINTISQNKKSRADLMASMDNVGDMFSYWAPLSPSSKDDIVAYLRGLSGVPGYYLNTPDGSNADIKSVNNVTPVQIKNSMLPVTNVHSLYQVLIIRKLRTNNTDDAQFEPSVGKTYPFGVALMNNDGKNHIGSTIETLTFK
jgi:hypothetical protein